MKTVSVCVVGIWHLGSIYSACLAELGYHVTGVDADSEKVSRLNEGVPPLFEPGLDELISKNIQQKRLRYTTDLEAAVKDSSFILITYDTPVDENDEVDLSGIFQTIRSLTPWIQEHSIIILSSQVPVGTCNQIKESIKQARHLLDFEVAYVPENLRLGQAISRFMKPDLLVLGADNQATLDRVAELFKPLNCPKIRMNLKSAEMTKHALNAFLATSISFANELGNLCDCVGADFLKVAQALRLDSRIGPNALLKPGLGFSGGTLARDVKVLQKVGSEHGCPMELVTAVFRVNQKQNQAVLVKLKQLFGSLDGLTFSVFGLTYKPGTSTLRRSVALEIIKTLEAEGAKIKAYDPKADLSELKTYNFEFFSDPLLAAQQSQALIFVTEWPEFKNLDFTKIKTAMKTPIIIDPQNMLDGVMLEKFGFTYLGTGRGKNLVFAEADLS
ncbi:MAG: nucleotide sugar dehydrogenase [Candidatus Bathyarchaeota archaeon]|nr:nucleotide sugar dehydrogenase [Candidatus Bathyarchaeota archaeon]